MLNFPLPSIIFIKMIDNDYIFYFPYRFLGSAESVLLAQFLVTSNIEFFRREREGQMMPGGGMAANSGNILDNFAQNDAIRNNPEAMNVLNQMNQMLG